MEHPLLSGRVGMDRLIAKAALRLMSETRRVRENPVNLRLSLVNDLEATPARYGTTVTANTNA